MSYIKQYIKFYNPYGEINQKYIYKVYAWLSGGLFISFLSSWMVARYHYLWTNILLYNSFIYLIISLHILTALILTNYIHKLTKNNAIICFILYSFTTGINLSTTVYLYTYHSIFSIFLITSIMYAFMSIWGYTIQYPLNTYKHYMLMFFIGTCTATLINYWLNNIWILWCVSYIHVIIFLGLTIYDIQKLKKINKYMILYKDDKNYILKHSIINALELYLNYINLYISMVQLLGYRKRNKCSYRETHMF